MTSSIIYKGNLRCEAKHIQSGSTIETDAPTDNRGKGERFSPTDLLCVSLATCTVTTMAIRADDMGIDLRGTEMNVTKTMLNDPRRVGKIEIELLLPANGLSEKDKTILERVGDTCPVKKSLNAATTVEIKYTWR